VQEIGHRGAVPNLASLLADALLEQGRLDEAGEYAEIAREAAQTGDVSGEAFWRMATARVLVRRGRIEEAVDLALESVELIGGTEELLTWPELLVSQADVLALAGRGADAAAALRDAIALWARKGALAEVRRAEERLAALEAGV
jgi:tetratricopeptide (TPR) repeat protein